MFWMLRMEFLTNIFQNVWATTIGKQIFEQNSFWTSNAGNIEHFFQKPQTVQKKTYFNNNYDLFLSFSMFPWYTNFFIAPLWLVKNLHKF